jgi:tetratricopeptide (TPR) repeat protein
MEAARWERVKEVFSAALEQETAARQAYLDTTCAGDPDLRAEIDSLLAAHDQTGDFIERPAAQRMLELDIDEPRSWIGRRVGAYRIVAEIGRGGMSEVFRGVRADDEYHKEVAVKVLLPGHDTRLLLERFKAEKQMLANLDHPNIARILDAGSTDDGLPYLVMDYIKGRPIDEYCRERHLSVRARLELFRSLCSAVQYVHQHLMVHGDLKCSNVLVTDEGSVRLLDFGVARLTNAVSPSDLDSSGPIALTPEYASPEQLRGGLISTASDVYSLGVMLYRLLAGRLPHGSAATLPHELASEICTTDPPLPSQAVGSHWAAGGLRRKLAGDLDSIVMRALHKDPTRRYPSVESLSEDLGLYLGGFPVTARPAGLPYKLIRFCGRHRAGIAAMGLFVLALIGGVVAASWQAHIARQERARAERHFDEVRKLANTFMSDVHEAIRNLPGATQARQILVLNSLKYLDALAAESAGDPTLQRELATAYEKVADVQGAYRQANVGDASGAIASYRKALDIRLALVAAQPADLELRRDLLRSYGKLGEVLSGAGDAAAAIASSRHALEIAEELADARGADTADRRNRGSVYVALGWQMAKANQIERGLLLMNQGTAIFETLIDANPRDVRSRHHAAVAYGRMGEILIGARRYDEALQAHTKQQEIAHALSVADPSNAELQILESYALLGVGTVLSKQGAPREALVKQTPALNTLRALFDADAKDTDARYNAAFALSEVAETLTALGQLEAAERDLRDALAIIEPTASPGEPAAGSARLLQGVDLYRLAKINARQASDRATPRALRANKCDEARRLFEQSAPILEAAERAGQWQADDGDRSLQTRKHLNSCAAPRAV